MATVDYQQFWRITRCTCVLQAEARAEFAEKTVKKLQKEVDRLEGNVYPPPPIPNIIQVACRTECILVSAFSVVHAIAMDNCYFQTCCIRKRRSTRQFATIWIPPLQNSLLAKFCIFCFRRCCRCLACIHHQMLLAFPNFTMEFFSEKKKEKLFSLTPVSLTDIFILFRFLLLN